MKAVLLKNHFAIEIGFTTDDVEQTVAAAVKAGAQLLRKPNQTLGTNSGLCSGSEGFLIEICTYELIERMKKHFPYLDKALRKHYPDNAETLISSLHATYNEIKRYQPNDLPTRLISEWISASFLALVKVLDKQELMLKNCEISLYIANDYVQPKVH